MPTPRSEAIKRYKDSDRLGPSITHPETSELTNKIDHYAILARIIDASIDELSNDGDLDQSLSVTPSINALDRLLKNAIHDSLTTVFDRYQEYHRALSVSQQQRADSNSRRSRHIDQTVMAGVEGAVNTMSEVHASLTNCLSLDLASRPKNYKVVDRLAKVSASQSYAYRLIYLDGDINRDAFLSHFDVTENGVTFKPGYPLDADVPSILTTQWSMLSDDQLSLDQPLSKLSDVETDVAVIGCPITFNSANIRVLWEMYTPQASRIRRASLLADRALSSDGNDAF